MRVATLSSQTDRDGFYAHAAFFLQEKIHPADIVWDVGETSGDLFLSPSPFFRPQAQWNGERRFEVALLHRNPERFSRVYRLLYRLSDNPKLLSVLSDADVRLCLDLENAVRRDKHKMRAFVRFRKTFDDQGERFVAWFEPDHHIVEDNASFFVNRFANMRWSILTPDVSAHYEGGRLTFGPGGSRSEAPADDALEEAWKTYFGSIFNPTRLMTKAMKKEMPKKYWRNLPEASLIQPLIAGAAARSEKMVAAAPTPARAQSPVHYLPVDETQLGPGQALLKQLQSCRSCPLYGQATKVVGGEGPLDASLMVVGEQPGDQEDLMGRPLIGPAGKVFDEGLKRVGLNRCELYVTNAVKHFKFTPHGKRRIHARPDKREISACRMWLEREIDLVQPKAILTMGATAFMSLTGKTQSITKARGNIFSIGNGVIIIPTTHPSYLLRLTHRDEKREAWRNFLSDLALARQILLQQADTGPSKGPGL